MSTTPLRIALLGGIPASIGGGGLETQRDLTGSALRTRGHMVFDVAREGAELPFDVLHAFGSEPDIWHVLRHWRKNPAPLVVSPVIVTAPGRAAEWRLRAGARVVRPKLQQRMRREILSAADLLVALTEHERSLLGKLAPRVPCVVIDNGVDDRDVSVEPDHAELGIHPPYVVLLGSVSVRKRQAESVRALSDAGVQSVVVGGFHGSGQEMSEFKSAVSEAKALWLGEVREQPLVRGLLRGAIAMVHLSTAEGQSLAILEALAQGTPVICSPLPSHHELARRFPDLVRISHSPQELRAILAGSLPTFRQPADIRTWSEVAGQLDEQYRRLVTCR